MFLGHYGLAFGVKKAAPQISLLTLFVAVEFVDIIWPVMLLLGIEKVRVAPGITEVTPFEFIHYPFTHSLLMGVVWGAVVGLFYWLFKKDLRSAVIVGLAVLSHWFLDFIVHVPDLPLTPFGSEKVGLGAWNSMLLTLLIEAVIFISGVYIYARNTEPVGKKGTWALWILVIFFVLTNTFNMFGPPPEDSIPTLFASFVVLQVIVLALAVWVDRNRKVKS